VTASTQLPAQFRPAFVDGLAKAAGSATAASGGGCQLPQGVPAAAAARVCQLGAQAFDVGFTDAAKATMILPAVVLALGAVACLAMARRPRRPIEDVVASEQPVPEPAA
jgi:hypothetical protein